MSDANKKRLKSIFLLIGMIQVIYFTGYYPDLKNRQQYLENEIKAMDSARYQAQHMESEKNLKRKLEGLERQLYVRQCKVPVESEDACNAAGLLKALKQYPLQHIEITKTGQNAACESKLEILENQYSISYQGDLENVRSFMQNIIHSTQMIHIKTVTISPFTTKEKQGMVEATLTVSTFVRKKDSV
ncbi:MAG: hypothetical protein AB9856_18950 [Cellulosilyticaceae bacterium]